MHLLLSDLGKNEEKLLRTQSLGVQIVQIGISLTYLFPTCSYHFLEEEGNGNGSTTEREREEKGTSKDGMGPDRRGGRRSSSNIVWADSLSRFPPPFALSRCNQFQSLGRFLPPLFLLLLLPRKWRRRRRRVHIHLHTCCHFRLGIRHFSMAEMI